MFRDLAIDFDSDVLLFASTPQHRPNANRSCWVDLLAINLSILFGDEHFYHGSHTIDHSEHRRPKIMR